MDIIKKINDLEYKILNLNRELNELKQEMKRTRIDKTVGFIPTV